LPTRDYRTAAGARVPGVTTVNKNIGWSTENLIRWANRQGLKGIDIRAPGGSREADVGTLVHALVEAEINGAPPPAIPEQYRAQAEQGLASFQRWLRQTRIEIIATEAYGVDEEYRAGWCLDALGLEEDGVSLLDWKSGGGPYPEHFLQAAAYTTFVERLLGEKLCGAHVCRFGKDTGIFHQVFFPRSVLDVGWTAWTWARALHEVRPRIEAYVR
jgi:hypothetical protein